jgi:DNA-binding NarL/FixJ family response regulator
VKNGDDTALEPAFFERGLVSSSAPPAAWSGFLAGQPGRPVKVMLVDDDRNIRKVISDELLGDLRTDLVAQGGSLREGRKLIKAHEFDVLMVDLNLGDGEGFELIERMKVSRPCAEAIVISVMEDEERALHAFELGATGYLVKNSWFGNFAEAVLQVVNGGASITPQLARRLLHRLEPCPNDYAAPDTGSNGPLSDREKEVLKLIACGYTSNEIGLYLVISCQTVNSHIKNIYRKLRVRSRAHAVSFAVQNGIL